MNRYDYVIVGGGLAGQRAAKGVRKVDAGGSLAVITREPHVPYERPPLSKGYLMGKEGLDQVYLESASWYDEMDVRLIQEVSVTSVDAEGHTLDLEGGSMGQAQLGYGKLLLATGGRAWRLPLPGSDLDNVFTLRTIEDSDAIRAAAEDADRALVLGGSFVGSEVTASLTQIGVDVAMVFPESRLLERVVPKAFSEFLHDTFQSHGVRIVHGTTADRLEGDGAVERAVLDNGEMLEVDMVVMGVGIRLNTELTETAGLRLGDRGEVIVDEYLRTSDPDIYAAGDIAAWPDPTFGTRLRVEHWDVARRQGLRAGRNMAGERKPYESLPYFFSDMFDLSFEAWGNLDSWDRTVTRGQLGSSRFMLFYFDQGTMVGVLTVGRLGDARSVIPKLVKAGLDYGDVTDALENEQIDLSTLLE
ncbi:MAG: FAD-dependent oxidoreductase [Anaerolineae bacterium]|jgi:NADPH-dependent 2,4-dienoyl-CoA reductase/sulfur reductase-like enzyme